MAKSQKKAFTFNADITVKAKDQATAMSLLSVMLERRGFKAIFGNEVKEEEIVSAQKAKPAKKAEAKPKAKKTATPVKKESKPVETLEKFSSK